MSILSIELGLASVMPLVAHAYVGLDDTTVVVELKTNPAAGLPVENLLFFSTKDFSADKVKVAIAKLLDEYARHGLSLRSAFNPPWLCQAYCH